MKIFNVKTINLIDQATIENEPITSINLMERAANAFYDKLIENYPHNRFILVAGPGKNGGDAIAIMRLLRENNKSGVVVLLTKRDLAVETKFNFGRLPKKPKRIVSVWDETHCFPAIEPDTVIIDGLFGSGLSRNISNDAADLVKTMNSSGAPIVSIDIPSGLFADNNGNNNPEVIVRATQTWTFQYPKFAFFLSKNAQFVGDLSVLDIGLHQPTADSLETKYYLTEEAEIKKLLHKRHKFSHKGNFGHALLISGAWGKAGAAIMASRACLRSGVGLLTVHTPRRCVDVLQTVVPEAMVSPDADELAISHISISEKHNAIGIGPGIGTAPQTVAAFADLLHSIGDRRLVVDADAINILSQNRELLDLLPPETILTPHIKEFERLISAVEPVENQPIITGFEQIQKAMDFCITHKVIIVMKGAYSAVIKSDGTCCFNPTGNPGMATAGSGDVLTGLILGLLAQNYSPESAAILGVYIHGKAGDLAVTEHGEISMIASDIIDWIGKAIVVSH